MGKPYEAELGELVRSGRDALSLPTRALARAVEDVSSKGLVIVASGGSQTAALYLAHLHQARYGHPCRIVTPLIFCHDTSLARGHVWLLSAGGRNADVLAAADHAIASGAASITALIATSGTPLQARLQAYGAARVFAYDLAVGADGFLATNSLWSMCVLLERVYAADFHVGDIREAMDAALDWAPGAVAGVSDWGGALVGLADPDTLIGMHDLEMRATEAALASVWVSDLRNLGHGRHYWFEAHRDRARAICLYTERYAGLASRTLELVGSVSPIEAIEVPGSGRAARLASIAWSMHAAVPLGRLAGRDPGRPGVPAFGEALYALGPPERRQAPSDVVDDLIAVKLGLPASRIDAATRAAWQGHLDAFHHTLAASEIRAIVTDFDGTLIETAGRYEPLDPRIVAELTRLLEGGLPLGIATGRGDSCGDALRNALPEPLHRAVWVGYHNGSVILPLSVTAVPDCPATPAAPDIEEVYERLLGLVVGAAGERGRVRRYPSQCSMTLLDGSALEVAWMRARAALADLVDAGRVNVWMSSHSIDVVLADVSKRSVVSALASAANCLPRNVLTLGDRGRWPGNDAELLDHPLSLSADECSLAPDRCWNLAGSSRRQVAATCHHLSRLIVEAPGVARFKDLSDE